MVCFRHAGKKRLSVAETDGEKQKGFLLCKYGKISAHVGKEVSDSVLEGELFANHEKGRTIFPGPSSLTCGPDCPLMYEFNSYKERSG